MSSKKVKFGSSSTAEEVASGIDLSEKVVIVTGANAGIGYCTALAFAKQGAHVIMACRDLNRSQPMLDSIKQATGSDHVELMQLDLGSFQSIRQFVKSFKKKKLPLHYLINNAGSMLDKKAKTADGFEAMVGINHLGPFLLTYELIDILKASAPSRIVNLSSDAHRQTSKINWDNLNFDKNWGSFSVYCATKMFNLWHARELNNRLAQHNVHAFSVHPGVVASDFFKRQPGIVGCCVRTFGKTSEQGAATSLYAALRADTNQGGQYFKDCKVVKKMTALSKKDSEAQRLWAESVKMCQLDAEEVEERFSRAAVKTKQKSSKKSKKEVVKEKKSKAKEESKSESESEQEAPKPKKGSKSSDKAPKRAKVVEESEKSSESPHQEEQKKSAKKNKSSSSLEASTEKKADKSSTKSEAESSASSLSSESQEKPSKKKKKNSAKKI